MKVVLAGAFGNLGAEILKCLCAAGHEVVAADLKERMAEGCEGKYTFVPIDATNPKTLKGLCDGADIAISANGSLNYHTGYAAVPSSGFSVKAVTEDAQAAENDCHYLDTQSILKDDKGNLKAEYCNSTDGIHMGANAYVAILEYIRTHAIDD